MGFISKVLFVAAAIGTLSTCTTQVAGTATEEGNPQIVATVVDENRQLISGASVTILGVSPADTDTTKLPATIDVGKAQTDNKGVCSFQNLPPGSYSLSVIDSQHNRLAFEPKIVVTALKPASPDFDDTLVVSAPGSMSGVVTRGGINGNCKTKILVMPISWSK
jgi:hypothetical protein